MARASFITQLSLDRFFQILGVHPLHGNQVGLSNLAATCGVPIFQYSWQTADKTSREEIAQAIFDAEALVRQYTNFDIGIRWNEAEEHLASRGAYLRATTDMKFLIEGGQKAIDLLSDGETVTYSDEDSDGYFETGTVTFNNGSDVDEDEVVVFYPDMGEEWRVRPIEVTVDHDTFDVVVKIRREKLVKPELLERLDPTEVDGSVDANFLSEVDVYRMWNDPSKQVEFVSNKLVACEGPICEDVIQEGCLTVRDSRLGIANVRPGTFDGEWTFSFGECVQWPYKIRLWYRAGIESSQWERAVAYLALSLLDRPICQCISLEHASRHWQEDLALSVGARDKSTRYQMTRVQLDNPLGTTRGALHAWNMITNNYVGDYAS